MNDDDGTLFQLGNPQGQEALRREIAAYLHHARGVNCKEDQIVVGAGNGYLLMLLHVILGMNRKIAMDNPTSMSTILPANKTMEVHSCDPAPKSNPTATSFITITP